MLTNFLCISKWKFDYFQSNIIYTSSKMPSFLSCIHRFFRNIDLFQTSKLLRYNGDTQYKTTTGGICSAAIMIILIGFLASMGLKTLNKEIINSSTYTKHQGDPSKLTFTTGSKGDLMFALFLRGLDLNSGPKLFDFTLYQETYGLGYTRISQESIPLVQCTLAHFNYTEELAQAYRNLNIAQCLCPPLGHQFSVQGKLSTETLTQLRLIVTRCDNSTDSSCVDDSTFSAYQTAFGSFNMVFAIVNTNISPMDSTYLKKYLDDRNFFMFGSQLGVNLIADVQSDLIQTDQSLTPWTEMRYQHVTYIPDKLTRLTYMKRKNQEYVTIELRKAEKSMTYSRSFNKIDEYLSYIGGLVGTFIGIIFIMGPYTEKCYEISLAKKLMVDNNRQEIRSDKFSIFQYIGVLLKKFISFFGFTPNWQKIQIYIESSQELAMQIDVTYIVRKLMFLDAAIGKLMQKHQIQALCMREKPTIKKTKLQRRVHFAPELLHHHKIHIKNLERQFGEGQSMHDEYIIKDIIERAPNNLITIHTKSGKIEDASALSFSQQQECLHNFKNSVCKVMEEGKAGNQTSNNILKQIIPTFLKALLKTENNKEERNEEAPQRQVYILDIESVDPSASSFKERTFSMNISSRKKREEEEEASQSQ